MKKIKITLLALLVSQSITVANAQSVSRHIGVTHPSSQEFSHNTWEYPPQISSRWRATYKETHVDRMFVETFKLSIPKGCRVRWAKFTIRVKNLGAQNYNDSLYFTDNNPMHLYGQKIWHRSEGLGTTKDLTFNLSHLPSNSQVISGSGANILNTLYDRKFSFFVQDDTSVRHARLNYGLVGGKQCKGRRGGLIKHSKRVVRKQQRRAVQKHN